MAFRSYDELINMASTNPKMAKMKVAKAKKNNFPVVSTSNTGYSGPEEEPPDDEARKKAIRNRMTKGASSKTPRRGKLEDAIRGRMKKISVNQPQDDTIVKRKKVGY